MEIYEHNAVHGNTPPKSPERRPALIWCAVVMSAAALVAALVTMLVVVFRPLPKSGGDYKSAFAAALCSSVEVYGEGTAASGVVYTVRGGKTYIVTNQHVVGESDTAWVRFGDNADKIAGEVLGYDTYHDIALVVVDGDFGKTAARSGAYPRVGTQVIAVGNNLGYGIAAFDGIVSHTDRKLHMSQNVPTEKRVPVFAVTSPVNAGMSGGGLFTLDGELIGINTYQTATWNDAGTSRPVDGMSYSVPWSIAEKIVLRIMDTQPRGQVGLLSVRANSYDGNRIDFLGLSFSAVYGKDGLVIDDELYVETPIELQGGAPKVGDIVRKIGTVQVTAQTDAALLFAECLRYVHDPAATGAALRVEVLREGKTVAFVYGNKRQAY